MLTRILLTVGVIGGVNGALAILLLLFERWFANYGLCNISINQEKHLSVIGGNSLLNSLNQQKIFFPSACGGRGTCAYCKCKVVQGAGPILPIEESLLTSKEQQEHVRLACQVKVKRDLSIVIPDELFKIKEFQADVVLIEDLTYDIKLIRLQLISPKTIEFVPGQYIQLKNNLYNK